MSAELSGSEAVAGVPARALRGKFYRMVPRHLGDRAVSTEGSELYGGRYNQKGAFGALYCGDTPALCRAEVRKAAAGRLGLQPDDLVGSDWAQTQELGRRAREAGFEALLVPSAAAPGANLVLFPDRLGPDSAVELLAVEPAEI